MRQGGAGGGVEVRRVAPGVFGSPLKAGQPHLSTLRRFGDRRIVIVRPPTPTLTKSNHLLPKPPSHRGPQLRCSDRSYSCVRNPDQSGLKKKKKKHRKEANLARVLPVIDEIEIETIIGTFGLSSVQFSCSVMSSFL